MRLMWCHGLLVALGACYLAAAQPYQKRDAAENRQVKQVRDVLDEAKRERNLLAKEREVSVKRVPTEDGKVMKSLPDQQARTPSRTRASVQDKGKTLQKRIFGVVLGQDYGSSNSHGGGFNYGTPDDYNYGRPRPKVHGYWEECQDQPGFECYYYYDDSPLYDYD